MSRTRYYPVSQSFLNDAETWEMRDQFGDRSVFMWMSLLSAGEMDDGNIHGSPAYIARIHGQYLDRTHPERAQNLLVYLTTKGWLTPLLKDGLTVGYFITNYWKYHKRRETDKITTPGQVVSPLPILPSKDPPLTPPKPSPIVKTNGPGNGPEKPIHELTHHEKVLLKKFYNGELSRPRKAEPEDGLPDGSKSGIEDDDIPF